MSFSKQRIDRRLELRRRNRRNHKSIYIRAYESNHESQRSFVERLSGAQQAFRDQIDRIIRQMSATKQRGR